MKQLHQQLAKLDETSQKYTLDYVTMKGKSFVYRHAKVVAHDETSITIQQEGKPLTVLDMHSIQSAQIIQ